MDHFTPFLPNELYTVVGYPIAHSLSPLVHNSGFQLLKLKAIYLKLSIEPSNLALFVQSCRLLPIRGCSVTMPHKQEIMKYLDKITPIARKIGAVNTLFWDACVLWGDNTDCAGFLAPLAAVDLTNKKALILGAGGACRALICGLQEKQLAEIYLCTPSNKRHLELAREFGCKDINWDERHNVAVDLVVNATPLGMFGPNLDASAYDFKKAQDLTHALPKIAYDIVYDPYTTRFLKEAQDLGIQTISGFEMFFAQANAQFVLWTSQNLPKESKEILRKVLLNQAN